MMIYPYPDPHQVASSMTQVSFRASTGIDPQGSQHRRGSAPPAPASSTPSAVLCLIWFPPGST